MARHLRRAATGAEQRLWRALRRARDGTKFRRQHPVGDHIVDFACPAAKLVIELDGAGHLDRQADDASRSAALARHGYRVIRFWNGEVTENLDGVVASILRAAREH